MFDGRSSDDVLRLAADSVPSLGGCHTDSTYQVVTGSLVDGLDSERRLDSELDAAVLTTLGVDQEIHLSDGLWRYALTLHGVEGITGVVVVRAAHAAPADELFLLKVLGQQTAAAMTIAALIEREREQHRQLIELTEEHGRTIERLSRTVTELKVHEQIHDALAATSPAGAGEVGIARALHELTAMTVGVENVFGHLRAWSGSAQPTRHRRIGGPNRDDVLRHAAATGKPQREGNRLFCVVRPKTDILGVLFLLDPDRRADELDVFALECAATVLALELSHQRALAEADLRVRRDFVEDLLAGSDDESAYARGEALGHDLRLPHSVAVLSWSDGIDSAVIAKAARHWAAAAGLRCLTARRPTLAILVTEGAPDPSALYGAVCAVVGSDRGSIGLGSVVDTPSQLPRSLSEARRALEIQKAGGAPHGTRRFTNLGVYRILDPGDARPETRGFVLEWLGPLLSYDHDKRSELIKTLAQYLDAGGNYDSAAQSLNIHRSTLRYRLGRIRDISGRDLQDVDTRLNLHLAMRVLDVIGSSDLAGDTTDHD